MISRSTPNGNLLDKEHEGRREMATLESSDNRFLEYPVYGEIYVYDFDINGYPMNLGFRPYRTNGKLGPMVKIGKLLECEWRTGFRDGAKIMKDWF
jgi:hypothetical protein